MKNLRGKEAQEKAMELSHLIAERKENKKKEDQLKAWFKEKAGNKAMMIKAGDVIIDIRDKESTSLDRKALISKFGEKKIEPFIRTTSYLTVETKGA